MESVTSGMDGSTTTDTPTLDGFLSGEAENGTSEEMNIIYWESPEDMLNPSKRNPAFYPIIITHVVTFIVGIIGNVIAMVVLWRDGKGRNVTTIFLVSLSASDLLLIITCVPLEMLQYFLQFEENWVLCKTARYMELVSASASVFNLCAVSLERYIVIVHPMKARSLCTLGNCYKAIIFIWIAGLFTSIPVLTTKEGFYMTFTNNITSVTIFYCEEKDVSQGLPIAIYKFVLLFAASSLFMMVCYFFVIRALWKSTKDINILTNSTSAQGKGSHNSSSVTKTVFPSSPNNVKHNACPEKKETTSGGKSHPEQKLQLLNRQTTLDNASSDRTSTNGSFVSGTGFEGEGEDGKGSYREVLPETKEVGRRRRNIFQRIHQARRSMYESSILRVRKRRPHQATKNDDPKATRKQVIKMLIMIIIVFLVCWGPKLILLVILKIAFIQGYPIYSQIVYTMRVAFNLIPLVHSCINPIVYCFMSRNFRRSMRQQLGRCCSACGWNNSCGADRDDLHTTSTAVSAWRTSGTTSASTIPLEGTHNLRRQPNTITEAVIEPTSRAKVNLCQPKEHPQIHIEDTTSQM